MINSKTTRQQILEINCKENVNLRPDLIKNIAKFS
jgi:hypothetical protein